MKHESLLIHSNPNALVAETLKTNLWKKGVPFFLNFNQRNVSFFLNLNKRNVSFILKLE